MCAKKAFLGSGPQKTHNLLVWIWTSLLGPVLSPGCGGKGQLQSIVGSPLSFTNAPVPTAECVTLCPSWPPLLNPVCKLLSYHLSAPNLSFCTPPWGSGNYIFPSSAVSLWNQPIENTRGRLAVGEKGVWPHDWFPLPARTCTPRTSLSVCVSFPFTPLEITPPARWSPFSDVKSQIHERLLTFLGSDVPMSSLCFPNLRSDRHFLQSIATLFGAFFWTF